MEHFETMFIVTPDLKDDKLNAVLDAVRNYISDLSGNVLKEDIWGTKQLAYEIDGHLKGVYCLFTFDAPYAAMKKLDRKLRENESIMRHMILHKTK